MSTQAEVLIAGGAAKGPALVLGAPISFWGGVDPASGTIIMPSHPDHGATIAGTVLFVPATVGSSSAASVMLELVHNGSAPAALVFHKPDAILIAGLVAAREMGLRQPAALRLDADEFGAFADKTVDVSLDGKLAVTD